MAPGQAHDAAAGVAGCTTHPQARQWALVLLVKGQRAVDEKLVKAERALVPVATG